MNVELREIQRRLGLDRIMQVGAPVIDENHHVMVPTEFGEKDIRVTRRLISGGFLRLADEYTFEQAIENSQIRTNMIKLALSENFDAELARKIQ